MRVLHAISGSNDPAALALVCGMRDAGVDCVVLAQAGSPTAVLAATMSLSTFAMRPDECDASFGATVTMFGPDLVHVHGVAPCGERANAPQFGARADVVTLGPADLDEDGLPALGSRIPEDSRCAVLLPACASRDEARVRTRLPPNVRYVAWASRLPITQCAGIYGAMLSGPARRPH